MKYIIGLGNPGIEYELTRHNIGFLFLDYLAEEFQNEFLLKNKLYHSTAKFCYQGQNFQLIKPQTFMNLSGHVLRYLIDVEKADKDDILIIYDDFHLDLGKFRFRPKGSSAGHNGVNHIIEMLHSDEFYRLRLGIGEAKGPVIDYVLGNFSQEECDTFSKPFESLKEAVISWVLGADFKKIMSDYNGLDFSSSKV